jgi:hypothetical protein
MADPTKSKTLKLTTRHWRLYNPLEYAGPVDVEREFEVAKTAFVPLHLWNVGYPEGPAYPIDRFAVDMGSPEDTEIAQQVMDDYIKPCLNAAREASLTVFHVEPDLIANKYPISNLEWKPTDIPPYPEKWGNLPEDEDAEGPQSLVRDDDPEAHWTDAVPGWCVERAELVHGPGYREWEGLQEMDIVESCKPIEGEYVIKTTQQFDRILRKLGIVNLVYVGFTTQGCVLFSPGGVEPMSARGYRCMLIREATHGVEFPDTRTERLMTKSAIRLVEYKFGFTVGVADFIRACRVVCGQ